MKINRLASVIMRGTLLMDPRFAVGMMPMAARFLNGEKVSFFDDDVSDEAKDPIANTYCLSPEGNLVASRKSESGNLYQDAPVGSIMIINIEGTIFKDDYCGSPGTDTMSQWVKEAVYSDNIAAVILKINSGGGSVEGTGEFAQTVKWADAIKPMIAFTDGLCASAAYWIASACRMIFASYLTVEVGSIGTAIKFIDNREAMKMYGYKEIYINADPSVDKNQDYYKALDGDYGPIKLQILNPTNDVFLLVVRENREGRLVETSVKEGDITRIEPLSGKVYLAKKAIEIGLIDEISDFDSVCQYTMDLVQAPSTSKSQKTINMINVFGKFSKLSALAGKAAGSITSADVEGINEQIAAANVPDVTLVLDSELQALQDKAAKSDGSVSAADHKIATEKITQLEADLKAAKTAKEAAEKKAADLAEEPADVPTGGKKNGTDVIEGTTSEADDFYSEADAEFEQILANQIQLPK
ncbi:S49 family peptidase [Pedobacter sp. 22163]|uniref:S49 family peptidase n=1 Tax=Pedobacter sp. 22163 TaxID=3453883 RepID=UPI003F844BB1